MHIFFQISNVSGCGGPSGAGIKKLTKIDENFPLNLKKIK